MEAITNQPFSEQYRMAAQRHADLEAAASLLEECKTAVMAQKQIALGDIPVSHAERAVKASPQWEDYLKKMVEARKQANLAKIECEFLRMKFWENQGDEASKRQEMRMTGP